MDGKEYLERYHRVESFEQKAALLEEAKERENVDRELFARKRQCWDVPELDDAYKGLVPVFDPDDGRTLFKDRKWFEEEEAVPRLFDVGKKAREKQRQLPATVESLKAFKEQFLHVFAANGLKFLNWDNVVAAGGSVQACVAPIPENHDVNFATRRKFYHDEAYPGSDIDLFLYGLSTEEANAKLLEIYDAVSGWCPHEMICFRSANAVTIVSKYPFRHIQVVLRVYSSPYEVLAGFDVDSCTFLYDGKQVYTTPRGHHALVSGYNTVDVSRRSPSYEVRLAKYAQRGFEVLLPSLRRELIDPNIFDMPWGIVKGLQKLVVLERLKTARERLEYQTRHHKESGMLTRLESLYKVARNMERLEKAKGLTEESNYATVFLPWGPDFDATRLARIMRRKDEILNSKKFRGEREYMLHPCFIGTAAEILCDCAADDPPIPEDVPAAHLRHYVRGKLSWIEDDPGRQQIGSFHPVTDRDWEVGTYFEGPRLEVFAAINMNDIERLANALEKARSEWSIYERDYLGRSVLHVGLLAGSVECCVWLLDMDLVDPTLRLPDGRSGLHLVAEYNRPRVLKALLGAVHRAEKRWAAYEALSIQEKDAMGMSGEKPPRNVSLREFVNMKTFDQKWTALQLAVVLGRVQVVRVLLEDFGADGTEPLTIGSGIFNTGCKVSSVGVPLVSLTPYEKEKNTQAQLVDLLLDHGFASANSFVSSAGGSTAFHICALFGNLGLLRLIAEGLEQRGRQDVLSTLLAWQDWQYTTPLQCAVQVGHFEIARYLYDKLPHIEVTQTMQNLQRRNPFHHVTSSNHGKKGEPREKSLVHHAIDNLILRWAAHEFQGRRSVLPQIRQYAQALKRLHIFRESGETDSNMDENSDENEGNDDDVTLRPEEKFVRERLAEEADIAADMLLWTLEKDKELKGSLLTQEFDDPGSLGPIAWGQTYYSWKFEFASLTCHHNIKSRAIQPRVTIDKLVGRAYDALCMIFGSGVNCSSCFEGNEETFETSVQKVISERENLDKRSFLTYQARCFLHCNRYLGSLDVLETGQWIKVDKNLMEHPELFAMLARLRALHNVLQQYKENWKQRPRDEGSVADLFCAATPASPPREQVLAVVAKVHSEEEERKETSSPSRVKTPQQVREALSSFRVIGYHGETLSITADPRKIAIACDPALILQAFQEAYEGSVEQVLRLTNHQRYILFSEGKGKIMLSQLLISRCSPGAARCAAAERLFPRLLEAFQDIVQVSERSSYDSHSRVIPAMGRFFESPHLVYVVDVARYLEEVGTMSVQARVFAERVSGTKEGTLLSVDLGTLAIIQNDSVFLRMLIKFQLETEPVYIRRSEKRVFSAMVHACIRFNRLECLREVVVGSGAGVDCEKFLEVLGLSRSGKMLTYSGMSTILQVNTSKGKERRIISSLPKSWAETAATEGSWKMLSWLTNNLNEVAEWFDAYFAMERDSEEASSMHGLGQLVMRLVKDGACVLPGLNAKEANTPGHVLAVLVAHHGGSDFGSTLFNGRSLFDYVLEGNDLKRFFETFPEKYGLVHQVCRIQLDRDGQTSQMWPIHTTSGKPELLRSLLEKGADPLQVTVPEQQNCLQLAAVSGTSAEFADIMKIFQELFDEDLVSKALENKDANGMNCFHILFRRFPTRQVLGLLKDFMRPDWHLARNTAKDGSTLLHTGLDNFRLRSIESYQCFSYLLDHLSEDVAATVEDVNGVTTVDKFIQKRRIQAEDLGYAEPECVPLHVHQKICGPQHDHRHNNDLLDVQDHPMMNALRSVEEGCLPRKAPALEVVQLEVDKLQNPKSKR